jgi:hypothetical protein
MARLSRIPAVTEKELNVCLLWFLWWEEKSSKVEK